MKYSSSQKSPEWSLTNIFSKDKRQACIVDYSYVVSSWNHALGQNRKFYTNHLKVLFFTENVLCVLNIRLVQK